MEILVKINIIDFFNHYHFLSFIHLYIDLMTKCFLLLDERGKHLNLIRFFQKNLSNKFRMFHAIIRFPKDLIVI